MPWSSQNGGGGNNGGPWGTGPSHGGGGDDRNPNDIEDFFKKGQDQFKKAMPGQSGPNTGNNVFMTLLVLGALVALLIYSCFVRINPDEQGIVLRFGEFNRQLEPGPRFRWPNPIEVVYKPKVTAEKLTEVGVSNGMDIPAESLMLTGDGNIVDVDFTVKWEIKNGKDYLFNIESPDSTVKQVAESAMREVVGKNDIGFILTKEKQKAELAVQESLQNILDSYKSGIQIIAVSLQKVDPPSEVIDAFRDVESAKADKERLANQANAYANKVVPEARGEAEQIIQAAKAYKDKTVAEAEGQAARFDKIHAEYTKAPEVTRRRMYLETMERVFGKTDKIILDNNAGKGGGVVPYLPLSELGKQRAGAR